MKTIYDLQPYRIEDPERAPSGRHFAIVLYKQENEWTPPYDHGDTGSSSTVTRTCHYAFTDKATWESAIEMLALERAKFVAMKVEGVASVRLRAVVEIAS